MEAIKFEESNEVLRCEEGDYSCKDLPIHRAKNFIVSCWSPTPEELEEIQRTGKIYFICTGQLHPAMHITGKREELFLPE